MTDLDDIKGRLVGAWELHRYIESDSHTEADQASGSLEYGEDGSVKARIRRKRHGSPELSDGGYDGHFRLTDANTVIHHVESSPNPKIVGLKLERHISFPDENTLIIRGKRSGETTPLEIHWKRKAPGS